MKKGKDPEKKDNAAEKVWPPGGRGEKGDCGEGCPEFYLSWEFYGSGLWSSEGPLHA